MVDGKVNREAFRLWVAALRDGTRQQGNGLLVSLPDDESPVEHCCMGVAALICPEVGMKKAFSGGGGWVGLFGSRQDTEWLPAEAAVWLGLQPSIRNPTIATVDGLSEDERELLRDGGYPGTFLTASAANDILKWDFLRIADAIEVWYLGGEDGRDGDGAGVGGAAGAAG